jgi:hypothetical protein
MKKKELQEQQGCCWARRPDARRGDVKGTSKKKWLALDYLYY